MSIPPIPKGLASGTIEDVANRLNSLSIHIVRRVARANASDGVTPGRLSLLSVIVYGGVSSVSELARAEQVSVPAVTRMLDAMESDGLVYREPDKDDRRVVRVHATDEGRDLIEAARAKRVQHIVEELSFLSDVELETLLEAAKLLERVEDRAHNLRTSPHLDQ